MSRLLLKTLLLSLSGLLLQVGHAAEKRWYSQQQVDFGKLLFTQNCASCHGANGESTPKWREKGPDGKYPAPPLNGSAHAWHHPLDMLRNTVREGGAKIGGIMPPFKDKLGPTEIDAIIAFFQSQWNDEIYGMWQKRNSSKKGFQRVSSDEQPKPQPKSKPRMEKKTNDITRYLKKQVQGAPVGAPTLTAIPGIYQVKVGGQYVYMTRDGRLGIAGELIDFEQGIYLTEQSRIIDRLNALSAFPESDMVVYPAEGKTKAAITVFTDTSCPFCRKLHKEVPKLQKAGVKVRYIPFPRNGKSGDGYAGLSSVWCAKDRRKAMDIAKGERFGMLGDGDCKEARAVDAGYRLGIVVGVKGTPSILFPNGEKVDGYMEADKILQVLDLKKGKGEAK